MQRKLMGLLIVMASSAFAQTSQPLGEDDPAVWAAREVRAKSLKEESSRMRNAANAQRAQADLACRKKIFENACKNSARETWIEEINKVRAMEIEAVGLERNQRAHELAMREKEHANNPPRPPLILPQGEAAVSQPNVAPVVADKGVVKSAPKSAGKPARIKKPASNPTQTQQERERTVEQATARAAQQKKDAARYAARASEHAAKEAARKAGKASSSAAHSFP